MTGLLTWKYFVEYGRRPLNLALLAIVPMVFVTLSAGAIVDFAEVFGGLGDRGALEATTAGWAAAFLTGVAAFFHVTGSREADRRLAATGAGIRRVVLARLGSGLVLALVAVGGSIGALWLRADIADPARAIFATALFALIYLAVGTGIGAVVHSEVNGSLLIIFVWMFDVFLGPTMMGSDVVALRALPTHFPTLVMTGAQGGHAGPLGDLGASLLWAVGGLVLAAAVLARTTRAAFVARPAPATLTRFAAALRHGFRAYRRNTALWILLVFLPVFFITVAIATTPADPAPVRLVEGASSGIEILSMRDVHGAVMVPITVAFLAGLAGMFVVLDSADADRRLLLGGYRPREVITARITIIGSAAMLATAVSLLVTARDFAPQDWITFTVANVLVALTYGMLGVIAGITFGRVGGLYVMFLVPFVDLGLAQNPMFSAAPPSWARFMPGYGASRVLVDGAFTPTFDETAALGIGLGVLVVATTVAIAIFHHVAAPTRA